jgi:hypothetical protein
MNLGGPTGICLNDSEGIILGRFNMCIQRLTSFFDVNVYDSWDINAKIK